MKLKRRRQHLTPMQRVLIQHVIGQAILLAVSLYESLAGLALAISFLLTLITVARLVSRKTIPIIVARSLEPLLIIGLVVAWLGLIQLNNDLSATTRSVVLIGALLWQARYLLVRFDPELKSTQNWHSLGLMILIQTVVTLWVIDSTNHIVAGLIAVWLTQYIVAHFWLERIGFHNSFVAGAWALVAAELVLLSSFTLVVYRLPLTSLLISRTSLATAAIGYSWGTLLKLHSQRKLTKSLVLEYGMICALGFLTLFILPAA